jgi:hypothetical protein
MRNADNRYYGLTGQILSGDPGVTADPAHCRHPFSLHIGRAGPGNCAGATSA